MNQLPIIPLSPEEQQKIMGQVYRLMGKQVQSYHKHHRMGNNSSVPVELAQELMESIAYTIDQVGGIPAHRNVEEALRLGQDLLEKKRNEARSMLELVNATAPRWQTECRWDALRYLGLYLEQYDPLHLAHRGPEDLFYPTLITPPKGVLGINICIFYLNILWVENRIMAGVPDDALEALWDRLPAGTLNQCEHLLINGIGKAVLGTGIEPLLLTAEERIQLNTALMTGTAESLNAAAKLLCGWLDIKDESAAMYVEAVIPQLAIRTGNNARICNLDSLFL